MGHIASLSLNEVRIPDKDEVDLWFVAGLPGSLYPTKIAAEVAARQAFPEESPEMRYSRIRSMKFYRSY